MSSGNRARAEKLGFQEPKICSELFFYRLCGCSMLQENFEKQWDTIDMDFLIFIFQNHNIFFCYLQNLGGLSREVE